jgi:hypothetical protein
MHHQDVLPNHQRPILARQKQVLLLAGDAGVATAGCCGILIKLPQSWPLHVVCADLGWY